MAGKKGWNDQSKQKMTETRKTNKEKRDQAEKDLKDPKKK